MGYHTPYFGKWHVSIPVAPPKGVGLQRYGFNYNTYPDPTGYNLQGTFGEEPDFHNDAYTASQAVQYLENFRPQDSPFCLTVSLVNPHDREFFPAGTEFLTVRNAYQSPTSNPNGLKQNTAYSDPTNPDSSGPNVDWDSNYLKDPPHYGYPDLPPTGNQLPIDRRKRSLRPRPSSAISRNWSLAASQKIRPKPNSPSRPTT
jgi:arylsulfatase A-like enzyme